MSSRIEFFTKRNISTIIWIPNGKKEQVLVGRWQFEDLNLKKKKITWDFLFWILEICHFFYF